MKTLLSIEKLNKAFGSREIFTNASLSVRENQKIGCIGRNGAGKSTLFKVIVGQEEYDSGSIIIHPTTNLGYLKQENHFLPGETVIDYLLRISERPEWQCGKAAHQFGLTQDHLYMQVDDLSGGYQMRVKLAAMIAAEPNLILLDEPTNYLDLNTVLLLEKFLISYRGSYILISHDREFIKRTCQETLEVEDGKLTLFPRPLEEYISHKQVSKEAIEKYNAKVERHKEHLQSFVDRFRAKASKAAQAQSKMKQIAKLETIEIANPLPTVDITIPKVDYVKGMALRFNNLSVGYEGKVIASGLTLEIEKGDHVAIVGENGQGKSTLLKTIAGVLEPVSGAFRFTPALTIGFFAQDELSKMKPSDTALGHLKRYAASGVKHEDIMRMASNFLFRDDELEKRIEVLSGGEKKRLALASLLLGKDDVLILDEPTNHLDFETVEALGLALAETNRTVIFVSHDRTFNSMLADRLIVVADGKLREFMGTYQDYVDQLSGVEVIEEVKEVKEKKEVSVDEEKEIKKKLREIEHELADLQKQREKILKTFETDLNFNLARAEKLKVVEKEIKTKEEEWSNLVK